MKLYNVYASPIAARCRIQIYAKGLDIEIAEPPGGVSSPAYKAVNPTGKVPALEVDGDVIPESHVILSFLEERYPEPSLVPADDMARARMWALARMADLYVLPPVARMGRQLALDDPSASVANEALAELETGVDRVESFMGEGPYAVGEKLTLADCSLAPVFLLATNVPPAAGFTNPIDRCPRLRAWWRVVGQHSAVHKAFEEMSNDEG